MQIAISENLTLSSATLSSTTSRATESQSRSGLLTPSPTHPSLATLPVTPQSTSLTTHATIPNTDFKNGDGPSGRTVAGAVVGSVIGAAAIVAGICFLIFRSRRRGVINQPAANTTVYRPLLDIKTTNDTTPGGQDLPFTFSPLELDITQRDREVLQSQAVSRISLLPTELFQVSPDREPYSPAMESSEFYATAGGHSEGHSGGRYSAPPSATASRSGHFSGRRRTASRGSIPSQIQPVIIPTHETEPTLIPTVAKEDGTDVDRQ